MHEKLNKIIKIKNNNNCLKIIPKQVTFIYFSFASRTASSQGTVSSTSTTCLLISDHNTRSGFNVVYAIEAEN